MATSISASIAAPTRRFETSRVAQRGSARVTLSARAHVRGSRVADTRVKNARNAPRRRTGVVTRAGNVEKLTAEELEVAMQDRDRPLVIDFYATWCGPCVLLAQELEKVCPCRKHRFSV